MTNGNLDSLPRVSSTSINAQRQPLATTTSSSIPHPHSTSEAKESQRPQSSGQTEKATTKSSQIRTISGNLDSSFPVSSTSTDTQNNQIRITSIKHDPLSPMSSTSTDTRCLRVNTTNSKNQQPQSSRPIERATTKNNQIRTTSGTYDSLSPVSSTSTDNKRRPPSKMTSGESSDK